MSGRAEALYCSFGGYDKGWQQVRAPTRSVPESESEKVNMLQILFWQPAGSGPVGPRGGQRREVYYVNGQIYKYCEEGVAGYCRWLDVFGDAGPGQKGPGQSRQVRRRQSEVCKCLEGPEHLTNSGWLKGQERFERSERLKERALRERSERSCQIRQPLDGGRFSFRLKQSEGAASK
ncbi:MAG: hypothetical protein ACYS4W_01535 [Planctomycetota bacterium]